MEIFPNGTILLILSYNFFQPVDKMFFVKLMSKCTSLNRDKN